MRVPNEQFGLVWSKYYINLVEFNFKIKKYYINAHINRRYYYIFIFLIITKI